MKTASDGQIASVSLRMSDRDLRAPELKCLSNLEDSIGAKICIVRDGKESDHGNLLTFLWRLSRAFECKDGPLPKIVETIDEVLAQCTAPPDFGGYGFHETDRLEPSQEADIVFLLSAFLKALENAERARSKPQCLRVRPTGRRGMTMSEKIFAMHDVSRRGYVKPGDIIQVDVDWVLASELSWQVREIALNSKAQSLILCSLGHGESL